eukprot:4259211-Prymnesium_polylepis.1
MLVHPADLDDALCIGMLTMSNVGGGSTQLPFAVDDALLRGALGVLWAVHCARPPTACNAALNLLRCAFLILAARRAAGCRVALREAGCAPGGVTGTAGRLQVARAARRGAPTAAPLVCD